MDLNCCDFILSQGHSFSFLNGSGKWRELNGGAASAASGKPDDLDFSLPIFVNELSDGCFARVGLAVESIIAKGLLEVGYGVEGRFWFKIAGYSG